MGISVKLFKEIFAFLPFILRLATEILNTNLLLVIFNSSRKSSALLVCPDFASTFIHCGVIILLDSPS